MEIRQCMQAGELRVSIDGHSYLTPQLAWEDLQRLGD